MKKLFLICILLLSISRVYAHDWFTEYWQRLYYKTGECGRYELGTYAELRTKDHWKGFRFVMLSEQLKYNACKNLALELHYTYFHSANVVPKSPWRWTHRLEVEVNPTFDIDPKLKIRTRNRLEIRRIEKTPRIQYVFRQRTAFVVPLENMGRLKSYTLHNELFYDFATHLFNQDRFSPCQLNFEITKEVNLDVFVLLQFFIHNTIWHRSFILGSQLNF